MNPVKFCYIQCAPEDCDCSLSPIHHPPPMSRYFEMKAFRVKLRRGPGWKVKPEAECLDGEVFHFQHGWVVESGKYEGETAWIGYRDSSYPPSAPTWIASGDLEEV